MVSKNTRDAELERSEVLRILNNLQLFELSRFLEKSEGTGKERLKQMKKTLASPEKLKRASANAVLKLSSSLQSGANWGFSACTLVLVQFLGWAIGLTELVAAMCPRNSNSDTFLGS